MKQILLTLFFLLQGTFFYAAVTEVSGVAKDYAGKNIQLLTYTDKIINEMRILGETTVDTSGAFSFSVNLHSVIEAFIPMELSRGFIYLVPGKSYRISLPPYAERSLAQKLDPYFEPDDYLLDCKNLEKGEFNYQMMEFEDAFDYYTMKHITYGAEPDSINKSIADLRRIFADLDDDFQFQFKEYRYLLLSSMSPKISPDTLISSLNRMGADVANPAFWDVFNNLFDDFIKRERDGKEESILFDNILKTKNIKLYFGLIANRYGITDSNLKELVGIKLLYDLVNSGLYDRFEVVEMLRKLGGGILSEQNRSLLADVVVKVSINMIGTPAPDFVGIDENGKERRLSDFKGKYVYVNFCNGQIERTKRDLDVLSRFSETYKSNMLVVNLFLYDNRKALKNMAAPYKGNMVFLNAGQPDLLKKAFDLKNVPSFMLIDKNSNFMLTQGAEPNDELRLLMERLLKE
ncbi:MAG: redoxin domain-containing protein [Prevotellaceae bacterium]|nr:redoxin domain-containing protein [Prevotellaceae bacterium]